MTVSARVRLSPTPPALRLIRNIVGGAGLERAHHASRSAVCAGERQRTRRLGLLRTRRSMRRQHRRELREHQRGAARRRQLAEHAPSSARAWPTPRPVRAARQLEQPRIAAALPELEQRVEDRELDAGDWASAGERARGRRRRAGAQALVEIALRDAPARCARPISIRAADRARPRACRGGAGTAAPRAQVIEHGSAAWRSMGRRSTASNAATSPEHAGHHQVDLRPQLAEVVLDRRAGDAEAAARRQRGDGPAELGVGVLERLRLVEDHGAPRAPAEHA
jgi:hypothetical protein